MKSFTEFLKSDPYDKYECINYGRRWSEAMRKQSVKFPKVVVTEERTIVGEGIKAVVDGDKKGGLIVFSTDVNCEELSSNRIMNWLKQKIMTYKHRFNVKKMLSKIAGRVAQGEIGWTIGKYLDGCYKADNGQFFDENSISVRLTNIDRETMLRFAEAICADFHQESVLLQDFGTGAVYFIDKDTVSHATKDNEFISGNEVSSDEEEENPTEE